MPAGAEKRHYRQEILALTRVITAILNYDGSPTAGGFLFLQYQADSLLHHLKQHLGKTRRVHPKSEIKSRHFSRHV